jgi:hypothetical protein
MGSLKADLAGVRCIHPSPVPGPVPEGASSTASLQFTLTPPLCFAVLCHTVLSLRVIRYPCLPQDRLLLLDPFAI